MIFKTYDSDIDGITNKLGFSKRSFAEWGEQVSKSFSESEGIISKFKNTMNAVFIPQTSNNDKLIGDFQAFVDLMQTEGLSAEDLAKEVGDVDKRIVNYAKSTDVSKLSTDGFKKSIGELSISAKAGKIALQGLALVGNALAMAFASWVATEIISWLNDLAHAEENARKRSEELTSSYETEKKNIDDSIAKYKELSEKLDDTSLSTSEVKSIKEQLLSIQDQLNEKYGAEATQIDLVNGKYDEQIKKLDALAKKKASDYVAENYNDIKADEKYVSEKFNVNKSLGFKGSQARPNDYSNAGFDLKKYLDKYDKLDAKVINPDGQYGMTGDVNLITSGTRQEVYDQITGLFNELSNDFGESNEAVNQFKSTINNILKDSFDTTELANANSRIKKYAEAEILSNDAASKSYNDLVDAVDNYNTALKTGDGVDEAKEKLLETKQAAEDSTKDITNSGKVLQDVYDSLSGEAPIEFQVEIGKNVDEELEKSYDDAISSAKEKYGEDLTSFFEENSINTQEEIDRWNDIAISCDTATEAKKKYLETPVSNETPISFTESISKIQALSKGLDQLDKIYADVLNKEEFDWSSILNNDNFKEAFGNMTNVTDEYKSVYDDFIKTISNSPNDIDACQESFNKLATAYIQNLGVLNNLNEENKQATISMLEQMGIANAEEVVTTELIRKQAELEAQKYYTANATNELKNATLDEYVEFLNEADISDTAKQALARLELQKIAVNNVQIETSGDIERIYALAEAAGASAIQLAKLADAKAIIEKYNTVGLNGTVADLKKYEEAQAIIKSIEEGTYKVDLDFRLDYKGGSSTKKATESAKKSAKEAETALKDYIEAYLNFQEKSLDAGKINFKTYSDNVANFLKNMFDQGKISAKDYYDYTEKMLNKQKDNYDKALSAITNRLDKEIDAWQKKIDSLNEQNDLLNEQKDNYDKILSAVEDVIDAETERYQNLIDNLEEANDKLGKTKDDKDGILSAIADVYDDQIDALNKQSDAIQDQIDALQDKNDELDKQYNKEKALYELEKSQRLRNKKLYVEGKGYIYTQDTEAIRDAKKNLADIENNELIDNLKKEQDKISDAIENLQKYKQMWGDVSSAYEKELNKQLAITQFGYDFEKQILLNRESDIKNFKNAYIAIQKEIDDNKEMIDSYNEKVNYYNKLKKQWSDISGAYDKETNKQAAIAKWGANYEKMILSGRVQDIESFKNQYLAIQRQIDDNTELINSYNQKVDYYNKLKEQWQSLTDEYSNSVDDMYAKQLLGAQWESDVLSGRIDTLNDFRNQYISIQQQLADAAWNSANEQIKAAQQAQKAANGSQGSSGNVGSSRVNNTKNSSNDTGKWYVVDSYGKKLSGEYKTAQEAQRHAGEYANLTKNKQVKIMKFHTGLKKGLVDPSASNNLEKDFELVQKYGLKKDETHAILRKNEAVITDDQISNLADSLRLIPIEPMFTDEQVEALTKGLSYVRPNINIPKYDVGGNIANNTGNNTSLSIGEIHLHEVQNVDGFADAIVKYFPGKMVQAMNKNGR